ncbi:polysaccharide pyruvyl transferase family protein [Vibrio cyclitrophicus]
MEMKSLKQKIKYSFGKRPLELEKPVVIQFPVNDICDSKCQMCNIWKNKKSDDISIEALKIGLSNDLFDEVTGIGFNGGEPTLRHDLEDLIKVAVENLPNLKHVSLITNGYKNEKIKGKISRIGKYLNDNNVLFDLMVSLDGYQDIHEKVRGRSGGFKNAVDVISFAQGDPNVNVIRVGCTVIKENVYYLHDLLDFCIDNNVYIKFRLGVPHQRLYTENIIEPYALNIFEKYHFCEFLSGLIKSYEKDENQIYFYNSLINQLLHNMPRVAGCDWQHRGATITSDGSLAYCAVKSKSIVQDVSKGNLKYQYFKNQSYLNSLIEENCSTCHHDYMGLPTPSVYRKRILRKISNKIGFKKIIKRSKLYPILSKKKRKINYDNKLKHYREVFNSRSQQVSIENKENYKVILICGWYGTETLGDKAIVAGIIDSFNRKFDNKVKFVVSSLNPYLTEITRLQMKEFHNVKIVNPEEAILMVNNVDFLIFGGGPLMATDDLASMEVLFENTKKDCISVIGGCGVGPFGDKWHNESIGNILKLSTYRIYRDKKSQDNALFLGVDNSNSFISEDPAFTWLAKVNSDESRVNGENREKRLIIALRDFPYLEYAKHLSIDECLIIKKNYEEEIVASMELLIDKNPDLKVVLLPMCTNHFGQDDRWFYRGLFSDSKYYGNQIETTFLYEELSPIEYLKVFNNSNAILAMRFHSLVFGLSTGLNSIAIDYTLGMGKVKSLAEKHSVPIINMKNIDRNEIVDACEKKINLGRKQYLSLKDLTFDNIIQEEL